MPPGPPVALPLRCPRCGRTHRTPASEVGATACPDCGFLPPRTAGGAPVLLPERDSEASPYYLDPATRDAYLALHYPDSDPLAPLLGERTPPLDERYPFAVRSLWRGEAPGVGLDVGCACGRSTLALAADLGAAIGIDRSPVLVDAGRAAWRRGEAHYEVVLEGEITAQRSAPLGPDAPARERAALWVADALALPFGDGSFDVVAALNLLDRVPDPARLLDELVRVTRPGGLLVLGSPYTWRAEFTPRERWLGGRHEGDVPLWGPVEVRRRLAPRCRFEQESSFVFYIPEHARSGQLARAHVQTFRRVS